MYVYMFSGENNKTGFETFSGKLFRDKYIYTYASYVILYTYEKTWKYLFYWTRAKYAFSHAQKVYFYYCTAVVNILVLYYVCTLFVDGK